MAYLVLAIYLFLIGTGLLTSDTGRLYGYKFPIDFGEYKDAAGVVFVAVSIFLFWKAKQEPSK
jgi:hypothetical protein